MEEYEEERTESYKNKARDLEEQHHGDMLQEKMEELTKTKGELQKTKEDAMQSWLDSRPLIDELERLQSGLASARNQASMSNIVISELESQLEATNVGIKSKMKEELKVQTMTNEITQALDQLHEELERIKQETDEERRRRSKLKHILRMMRLTLRTSKLTLKAIQMESEAFGESATEALGHIKSSESENSTVQLSQAEYLSLKRRAKEQTSLAEWRISVSMEQKIAAKTSLNMASTRLKEVRSEKKMSGGRRMEEEKMPEDGYTGKKAEEQQDWKAKKVARVKGSGPKARAKSVAESTSTNAQQTTRKTGSKRNKKLLKKKKLSILQQIRRCISRRIRKLFG